MGWRIRFWRRCRRRRSSRSSGGPGTRLEALGGRGQGVVERGCLAFFGFLAFFLAWCEFVGPEGRYIIYKVAKMGRVGLG